MIPSEKRGLQKRLQRQVRRIQDCIIYCYALPENSVEERDTLRGVTRPGLSSTIKHIKGASDNERALVMRIDPTKKGKKKFTVKHKESKATSPNIT